jgi:hypothetical protein
VIANKLLRKAIEGDRQAIALVLERTEGKVSQPIEPSNGMGGQGPSVVFYIPDNGRDSAPTDPPTAPTDPPPGPIPPAELR